MNNYADSVGEIIQNKLPENDVVEKVGRVLQGATDLGVLYHQGVQWLNKGKNKLKGVEDEINNDELPEDEEEEIENPEIGETSFGHNMITTTDPDTAAVLRQTGRQEVEPEDEEEGVDVAEDSELGELTAESTALDETPVGWLFTAGLGVATLFTELGSLFESHPVIQAGVQLGI